MRGIIRSRAGELQSRTKPRRAARLRTIRIMSCAPAGESAALRSAQLTGVRSAVGNGVLPQPRRSPHPCGSRCRSAAVVQPSANPTGAVGLRPPLKSFTSPPPQPRCTGCARLAVATLLARPRARHLRPVRPPPGASLLQRLPANPTSSRSGQPAPAAQASCAAFTGYR